MAYSIPTPFFTRDRISDFDILDRHAEDVVSLLKERSKAGYAVDFQDLIGRFTMDSFSEFLFNNCVDSLKTNLSYPHNIVSPPAQSNTRESNAATKFNAGPAFALVNKYYVSPHPWMIHSTTSPGILALLFDEEAFPPSALLPPEWGNAVGRKAIERFRPELRLTMSTTGGLWIKVKEV
ncbi:hypothetical protein C8R45DRAFT_1151878 [Mycena sanguinolenta]|nr:hypothetical protein C8R45DRAFT_1151878 [Mycena sanguinolenta]